MQNEELKNFIHSELCNFKDLLLNEVNQKFDEVNRKFDEVNQRFEEVNQKINELDFNLKSVSNTVTLIEHDHGEKLAALMDYMVVNDEKHKKYDNDFKILKNAIENHSMRIDELEKSINY